METIGSVKVNGDLLRTITVYPRSTVGLDDLRDGELYDITIKKHREPRSLTANAYLWVLIDKIAQEMRQPRAEIYRHALHEAGVMSAIAVKESIADKVCEMLTDNKPSGTGDFAEKGNTKNGWTEVYVYHGSSKYNSKEMADLIDYVADAAHELGIATLADMELEELLRRWEDAQS